MVGIGTLVPTAREGHRSSPRALRWWAMSTQSPALKSAARLPQRQQTDRLMRRFLRLDPASGKASASGATTVFGRSVFISAVRCLLSYVVLPLLAPTLHFSNGIGPVVGLVLTAVSLTAMYFAMRRFFAADHRMRWQYAALAGGISVLLLVQSAFDIATLLG